MIMREEESENLSFENKIVQFSLLGMFAVYS